MYQNIANLSAGRRITAPRIGDGTKGDGPKGRKRKEEKGTEETEFY